jgi:hypothetical protein
LPRAVLSLRGGDGPATACETDLAQETTVLDGEHEDEDQGRGDEHTPHAERIGT